MSPVAKLGLIAALLRKRQRLLDDVTRLSWQAVCALEYRSLADAKHKAVLALRAADLAMACDVRAKRREEEVDAA